MRTTAEVVEAIRSLRVRGAPLIGVTAAYAMARDRSAGERLKAARPTAVNLAWAVDRMISAGCTPAEARRIHAEDAAMCAAIGRAGARVLGRRVLTICNTGHLATGGTGTAFSAILHRRPDVVYACETRPLLQGARLTMWEARKCGLNAVLIVDSAAASLMAAGEIDTVITGADRIARNGDTANKIGTYGLAVLARAHGLPFYVAAPCSTIDPALADGQGIPIEERGAREVQEIAGRRIVPAASPVRNPAFDVTPAALITAIVTERGVFRAPYRFTARTP